MTYLHIIAGVGIMGWYVKNVVPMFHLKCKNVPLVFTYNEYRWYYGTLVHWDIRSCNLEHWYIYEKPTLNIFYIK